MHFNYLNQYKIKEQIFTDIAILNIELFFCHHCYLFDFLLTFNITTHIILNTRHTNPLVGET